jgi:hypothetical protein
LAVVDAAGSPKKETQRRAIGRLVRHWRQDYAMVRMLIFFG